MLYLIQRMNEDKIRVEKNLGSGGTQVRILWAGSSSCVCFSTKNPGANTCGQFPEPLPGSVCVVLKWSKPAGGSLARED